MNQLNKILLFLWNNKWWWFPAVLLAFLALGTVFTTSLMIEEHPQSSDVAPARDWEAVGTEISREGNFGPKQTPTVS